MRFVPKPDETSAPQGIFTSVVEVTPCVPRRSLWHHFSPAGREWRAKRAMACQAEVMALFAWGREVVATTPALILGICRNPHTGQHKRKLKSHQAQQVAPRLRWGGGVRIQLWLALPTVLLNGATSATTLYTRGRFNNATIITYRAV